jgi:hypothetical protein
MNYEKPLYATSELALNTSGARPKKADTQDTRGCRGHTTRLFERMQMQQAKRKAVQVNGEYRSKKKETPRPGPTKVRRK